jgi:hypothetical protein
MARYSLAIWTPLPGIGSYSEGPFKVIHHTTQGSSAAGAIATYRQTGNYPHFTVEEDVVYQHVDTNSAVTALEHPHGTVETNRSHAIQIELVGFAERTKSRTSLATMAALCRWLEEQHNIPPVWPNGLPYPPVNGHEPHVPFNRNETTWRNNGGHYGHCHVPHNHHWDPGYTADEVALVMARAAASAFAAALQGREPESMPAMTAYAQSASAQSASAQSAQLTSYVDKLVTIAKGEYQAFHTISETDEPLRSRIDTYCRDIGIAVPPDISQFPWSATFVSWCIRKAGATSGEFTFSAAHAVFVRAAIANADAQTGVFRARPIGSYAPQVGDLIHRNRSSGTVTYAQARTNSSYPSHSAIVVEVGEDQVGRYAMTIGGNEHDSIRMTRVALNGAGMVVQKPSDPFICVVQDLKIDAVPQAAGSADASAASRRLEMAKIIVDYEARRDAQHRLVVFQLDPEDGGGRYEVAGINERYNKTLCDELVQLVQSGRQQEAEQRAVAFIADDSEVAARWTSNAPIEFYLRDCVFNRGARGAAWILQTAVGVKVDQSVGPITLAAVARDEVRPLDLLSKLRQAREDYERLRRDETSKFWKGLVNRWNKALTAAKTFLTDGDAASVEPRGPTSVLDTRSPSTGDDQSWAERPLISDLPVDSDKGGRDAEAYRPPEPPTRQAAADEFDAPDPGAIREARYPVFRPQAAAAAALRGQSVSAGKIVEMHRALEGRLFARKPAMALAAAASDAPPAPQEMIVGVGIGAAHRDFESVGPAGPGAPVLNVYVTEPMGMEAVKRVLVDHYDMRDLASDRQPVNVHHTGPIFAMSHMHRERPSPCGISVGHYKVTAGTQGVLARGIAGSGRERRLLMLSNNHVLANVNDCEAGDAIHQPGPLDLKPLLPSPASQIGILERWIPLDFSGDNYVDCATAWCIPGNAGAANLVRKDFIQQKAGQWSYFTVSNKPIDAVSGLLVGKSGRTSQLTSGRIADVNVSISVAYENGKVANFKDQMTIVGEGGRPFGAGGDSGALIWTWNDDRSPVGLLFAVGKEYTFANKIGHVLQALQIELYT